MPDNDGTNQIASVPAEGGNFGQTASEASEWEHGGGQGDEKSAQAPSQDKGKLQKSAAHNVNFERLMGASARHHENSFSEAFAQVKEAADRFSQGIIAEEVRDLSDGFKNLAHEIAQSTGMPGMGVVGFLQEAIGSDPSFTAERYKGDNHTGEDLMKDAVEKVVGKAIGNLNPDAQEALNDNIKGAIKELDTLVKSQGQGGVSDKVTSHVVGGVVGKALKEALENAAPDGTVRNVNLVIPKMSEDGKSMLADAEGNIQYEEVTRDINITTPEGLRDLVNSSVNHVYALEPAIAKSKAVEVDKVNSAPAASAHKAVEIDKVNAPAVSAHEVDKVNAAPAVSVRNAHEIDEVKAAPAASETSLAQEKTELIKGMMEQKSLTPDQVVGLLGLDKNQTLGKDGVITTQEQDGTVTTQTLEDKLNEMPKDELQKLENKLDNIKPEKNKITDFADKIRSNKALGVAAKAQGARIRDTSGKASAADLAGAAKKQEKSDTVIRH